MLAPEGSRDVIDLPKRKLLGKSKTPRLKLVGTKPLLADWFTGILRVPRCEMLAYVHMGFGSVYEQELHIHVERGRVTGTRVYDNRGKEIDTYRLGGCNLPGKEKRFPGDRDFN